MKHARYILFLCAAVLTLNASPALAYEGPDTHVGLTTEAALASRLHAYLRTELGLGLGLFTRLELQGEAMDSRVHRLLQLDLDRMDPGGGYRPDPAYGQFAVSWALAGAVRAEMPASDNRHHFLCPATNTGLDQRYHSGGRTLALLATLEGSDTFRQFATATGFDLTGERATDWVFSPLNPQGVAGFYKNLAAAVSSVDPARRAHHLALTLTALGSMVHVLQDMASPTHVRNDFVPGHLEKLGSSAYTLGSAYERFVARQYGRLGIPRYTGPAITRASLRHFFHSPRWDGLADLTHLGHFSPGTIPANTQLLPDTDVKKLQERLEKAQTFQKPALGKIDLACAVKKTCYQRDPGSKRPMLAYRVGKKGMLMFRLDNRVHAAAAGELLPRAVGFSTGFIDHLLRGKVDLALKTANQVELVNRSADLVGARVRVFAEDEAGMRTLLGAQALDNPVKSGASLALLTVQVPRGTRKLVALLEGTEQASGDPVVATKILGI